LLDGLAGRMVTGLEPELRTDRRPRRDVMPLDVIGSGFGRTGTKSLKAALEQLGFGPCHHMHEVVEHPEQVAHWQAVAHGEAMHWEAVFAGYRAQVDWPGTAVWRELAEANPAARIVHSQRPDELWWASFSKTIGKFLATYPDMPMPPHISAMMDAWQAFAGKPLFGGRYHDREVALASYQRHNEEVRRALPADRLLVFDVADGWEPLCAFLGVPVPDAPFPHHNLRADFWEVLGGEPA
jgi:hypothetical protein